MRAPDHQSPARLPARVAVGYLRRSTDRQEQSLADQRRAIETHAATRGFEIVKWYTDDAISGATADQRRAFTSMLADARQSDRTWTHVLVYDVSRFSRGDLDEAGHLRYEFRKAGVEVVYINENLTGGDADDLVVGVKQWMAQRFVKDLSVTTIRGQLSHAGLGAWCGGTPPYGYDLLYHDSNGRPYQRVRWLSTGDKEIHDLDGRLIRSLPRGERLNTSKRDIAKLVPSTTDRVGVVRRIFSEFVVEGRGSKTIANGLNRDRIPSPRDGNWSANAKSMWGQSTVRVIVRNPAYRGDTVWNRRTFAKFHRVQGGIATARARTEASRPRENAQEDWVVVPGTHQPLVAPALFDRAQELTQARAQGVGPRNVRAGRGARSPYLLSGLVSCGRCGQNYQGRTVNGGKRREDGSRIKSFYYACGAWVMKGQAACAKFMLRRDPLEDAVLEHVQERLEALVSGEGERTLRAYIEQEIAAQGADPRREAAEVRDRLDEIDRKADLLLEGLASADAQGFVEAKLRKLAAEKTRLEARLAALDAPSRQPIDPDAILAEGLAAIRDLPHLLEAARYEERKELVRAFVAGVTVVPDERRIDLQIRKIPALGPGFTCLVVAGAGFEPATFGL